MDSIDQKHQESEHIEKLFVTINSITLSLTEAAEVIDEISVKLPSQFLITKITTSFEKNFDPLSMEKNFEAGKIEPEPTFENTINKIKHIHLKSITSTAMNSSAITSFDDIFFGIYQQQL